MLARDEVYEFREVVWGYYVAHGRHDLPWRTPQLTERDGVLDPYRIMVSEIMLQQTQVMRVIPKYEIFIARFPTIESLAHAELADVLRAWSGLGYNRRAKYLRLAAQAVEDEYAGIMPQNVALLLRLPGIGKNTAGAIMAYAFNEPVVFIETNIRTVYIHHFFHDQTEVSDADLTPLITQTTPADGSIEPRAWYWALMDYGTHLKASIGNASRASRHYVKQSAFEGSRRQIRGRVIKLLGDRSQSIIELREVVEDERLGGVLEELVAERMIHRQGDQYTL